MSTVYNRFRATALQRGDSDFLCVEEVTAANYGIEPETFSWRDAAQRIETLRAAYASAGYGHGHRVGLLLENRPDHLFHWLALNALGASVVPISAEMRSAELQYLIGHAELALVVALPSRLDAVQSAAAAVGIQTKVTTADVRDFPRPASKAPSEEHPGADSECALLYTSGTTGRPKGCRLSNDYFLHIGDWYTTLGGWCPVRPHEERIVTPLPMNHVNAMAFTAMAVMTSGGCLIQLDRFHPKTWWKTVRATRATICHYLGVMPAMLLGAEPSELDRAHSLRWAFGAGVARQDHARFEERFGFPLVEGWAMTETGAGGAIHANQGPREIGVNCFGAASADIEVRLVNDEGKDVDHGTPGELLVRAKGADPRRHFFSGYLKDEAATQQAWAGGWFHTGDIVRRAATGSMYYVDRKKNVIRRSGENISAVEVEGVLAHHPAVKTVAVAATPDAVRGDEVLACIVPAEPIAHEMQEQVARSIVELALRELAYYKAPGYVAFVEALPVTGSQKIQRGELRQLAATLPGTASCVDTRAMKTRQS
ncbi:AMP-binding protein [Variovorax atrisoli]|uniref:AMP-binding protein n=1 Tax=Variovorax atrisoli TaxID=3394203 RepID=UPI00160A136B|nr:AMP-binding protein [Variovorax sp. BK613]MBB3641725.1 acyl-CoA synthetase (AMP-forming)/AMP-acid ligase II [Variovorax sp. BK613]